MDNMHIYNKYRKVPKEALKPFDNGNFKGTDINTMWRIKCLTEEFGACGIGWAYDIVRTWTENGCNGEVLCFAEIRLFIKVDGEWSRGISAVGGSKLVSYIQSKQYSKNSDEGFKMAITDALGVACKLLGFGADVYWENDKTKYTNQPAESTPQNKPKTDNKPKVVETISRSELVQKYGVSDPEKTIVWLEGKIGKDIGSFTEEETAWAREQLEAGKKKREAEKRKSELERFGDDIPFPMGDE
jgi:hypothetical protein